MSTNCNQFWLNNFRKFQKNVINNFYLFKNIQLLFTRWKEILQTSLKKYSHQKHLSYFQDHLSTSDKLKVEHMFAACLKKAIFSARFIFTKEVSYKLSVCLHVSKIVRGLVVTLKTFSSIMFYFYDAKYIFYMLKRQSKIW